jgi:hypothetical protein
VSGLGFSNLRGCNPRAAVLQAHLEVAGAEGGELTQPRDPPRSGRTRLRVRIFDLATLEWIKLAMRTGIIAATMLASAGVAQAQDRPSLNLPTGELRALMGIVMSGWRPLIKGYFGVALVVGAVMSSAFDAEN